MKLAEWLRNITDDEQVLSKVRADECEQRIIRAYKDLLWGHGQDPSRVLKATRLVEGAHHGVVSVRDISFYSLCAHHFLPFFGKISITYEPGSKIIGLGKLPRLVQIYARRFQIQEDLVKQIAEEMMDSGEAKGVYVRSKARHLCMCSRGPSDDTVETVTTYGLGTLAGSQHGEA